MKKLALRRVDPKCGYGNVAEGLQQGLEALGVEVVAWDEPAPVLLHLLPPHFISKKMVGQAAWLLSMWETDKCPEGFRAGFPNFDGIFCPTEVNQRTFSEYHPNVHRIDMGVDHKFWTPKTRKVEGPFRFLYTAHSPKRKGGDVAQTAARLVAKTHDIELVPSNGKSDEDLRELYWSCHAYLQPSRGEGWGMMPHQALSTGMPVVISDCAGHQEYSWLPGCYLTDTTLVPSPLGFHGNPGCWWEPDVESVATAMRWVVDNYDQAHREAQQAHSVCERFFDWTTIAGKVIEIIGDDWNRPMPSKWEDCKFTEFEVTLEKNLRADIGERRFDFVKGVPQMVPSDVKRVLFDAGHLKPDVYDDVEQALA